MDAAIEHRRPAECLRALAAETAAHAPFPAPCICFVAACELADYVKSAATRFINYRFGGRPFDTRRADYCSATLGSATGRCQQQECIALPVASGFFSSSQSLSFVLSFFFSPYFLYFYSLWLHDLRSPCGSLTIVRLTEMFL